MAKFDLGHFIEAAGSILQGQMVGKQQGEQLVQQQQEQDFQRQLQALNLRRQFDAEQRAQEGAGLDTALRYGAQGLDPESRSRMVGDVINRQREIAASSAGGLGGLRVPAGPRWAGVRDILTPPAVAPRPFVGGVGQPPTRTVARPAAPSAPEDPYQQAMLQALQGASRLIPGGAGFLQAIQSAPPAQPAPAEAPAPTVTYPGLGPGGAPATYQIETVSPKDIANQERALQAANRNLGNAPANVVPIAQRYIQQWNSQPRTREELAANSQILRNLEALGIGTGSAVVSRGFREQTAEAKTLGDLPKALRGQAVNENTVDAVVAQMVNALEREDALNKERETTGKPPMSRLWQSQREKIQAMNANLEQGNAPEAMRLAGQVMDAVAFQTMKPQEQTRAMQSFFTAVKNASPEQLTRENVLAMAESLGVRHQVEDMVRAGMNFAAGPAAERLRKLLPQVKNFADLDEASQKVLIDQLLPLAKLSGQKLTIPAKFIKQMTPAQRDASARGWRSLELQGDRNEISRGHLAIADSNMRRAWQEATQKIQQAGSKGLLTESAALGAVRGLASEARRTYDKAVEAIGLTGIFDPTKPGKDSIQQNLAHLYRDWQNKLNSVRTLTRQYGIDPDTGQTIPRTALVPSGRFGRAAVSTTSKATPGGPPTNIPGLNKPSAAPTTGNPRARLSDVERRIRELEAKRKR